MAKINQKLGQVSFFQAIKDFFVGYVDFKGRTTRAGYWWVTLILSIGGLLAGFAIIGKVFSLIFEIADMYDYNGYMYEDEAGRLVARFLTDYLGLFILLFIISLALFLPSLAIAVRRYRDAGLRGRGTLTLYITSVVIGLLGVGNYSAFLALISSAISIFFFVLTLLPTDSLVVTSQNSVMLFFFRTKNEEPKEDEWLDY